ncbi:hypothetical protein SeMB42_g01415 [Synchytrium endobioticum]|uniref:RRM domain-containing protein n=1 Tax=Synchytrium endobioticum TaxID=286115 RepID=A0A507DJJ7_9FUNG|nr:hypothetical protein SeLEV6574_g00545 [Synchytrium endobioticum]TPX52441.1 hypothetical protein SeMB42_g01415 [Synchytrium endobioticum]
MPTLSLLVNGGVATSAGNTSTSTHPGTITGVHAPKTTIHVTNIPLKYDRFDLRAFFNKMPGFVRISFHADYAFVCFKDIQHASRGMEQTHATSDMIASYAKFGVSCNTTPSIAVAPNPILYISIFPYFTEPELTRIFKGYEGFDSARFFTGHCLVRFNNVPVATRALEDLNSTTNLFANYSTKGAKGGGGFSSLNGSGNSSNNKNTSSTIHQHVPPQPPCGMSVNCNQQAPQIIPVANAWMTTAQLPTLLVPTTQQTILPSASLYMDPVPEEDFQNDDNIPIQPVVTTGIHTIQVTKINMSKAALRRLFNGYEGFNRMIFHTDHCFVVFASTRMALQAMEELSFTTSMKAVFAKCNFGSNPSSPTAIGLPSNVIRVSGYPANTETFELSEVFEEYEGFMDIQLFHSSCLVHFRDNQTAHRCLGDINSTTNLAATYSKKGTFSAPTYGSSASLFSGSYSDHFTPAPSTPTSIAHTPGVLPSRVDSGGDTLVTPSKRGFGLYGGHSHSWLNATTPNMYTGVRKTARPFLHSTSSSATLVDNDDEILPFSHQHSLSLKSQVHSLNLPQHAYSSVDPDDKTSSANTSLPLSLAPSHGLLASYNILPFQSSQPHTSTAATVLSSHSTNTLSDHVNGIERALGLSTPLPLADTHPPNHSVTSPVCRTRTSVSSSSVSVTSPSTTNSTTPSLSKSGSTLAMHADGSIQRPLELQVFAFKQFLDTLLFKIQNLEKANEGLKEQAVKCVEGSLSNGCSPSPTDSTLTEASLTKLKSENHSLREELSRTRQQLEALERVHKQCGVFEGLLAICD